MASGGASREATLSSRRFRSRLARIPGSLASTLPTRTTRAIATGQCSAAPELSGRVRTLESDKRGGVCTDALGFPLTAKQTIAFSQWGHIVAAAERVQLQEWAAHLASHGFPSAPDSRPDQKGRVWRERSAARKGTAAERACKRLVRHHSQPLVSRACQAQDPS